NVDTQSATSLNAFTYDEAAPAITSVAPSSGPVEGGTTIAIAGLRFRASPSVTVGGVPARVLASSGTSITAETAAHAAGIVDVVVTWTSGESAIAPGSFTYVEPEPETFVRYFAEGASGTFFSTRFALANPHLEAVPVTVTFTDTFGTPTTMQVTLPPRSRT